MIGDNNIFQIGSGTYCHLCPSPVLIVKAFRGLILGNNNTLETQGETTLVEYRIILLSIARALEETVIEDNCTIGIRCTTRRGERIVSNTILFGADNQRMSSSVANNVHGKHVDYLKEVCLVLS